MRKGLIMIGLAGLLGCDERDVSRIDENVNLTRPKDCYAIKDIRYEAGQYSRYYQVLCSDREEKLILYNREVGKDGWQKIKVK